MYNRLRDKLDGYVFVEAAKNFNRSFAKDCLDHFYTKHCKESKELFEIIKLILTLSHEMPKLNEVFLKLESTRAQQSIFYIPKCCVNEVDEESDLDPWPR